MWKRTIAATALAVSVCAPGLSAQLNPAVNKTTTLTSTEEIVRHGTSFDWGLWPYVAMLIASGFAVEAVRQRRRETAWRRQSQTSVDQPLLTPVDQTPRPYSPPWQRARASR